jgi:Flp pilus assembly protein TadG
VKTRTLKQHKKNLSTKGILTVEAALVLPIFIYAIVAFIYFFQLIYLQEILQNAITETGLYSAKYAHLYDYFINYGKDVKENNNAEVDGKDRKDGNKNLNQVQTEKNTDLFTKDITRNLDVLIAKSIDSTFFKVKMQEYLDVDMINNSCIKNGFTGIHTFMSSYMEEDNMVDIIIMYDIKLPILFIHTTDIPIIQRVRLRGWNGHQVAKKGSETSESSDDEDYVYITETGTVYHITKECTHLRLSINEISIDQVDAMRNDSGGKYKECELCDSFADKTSGKVVYITDTGEKYHYSLNCSGLKRTIITILKSQVGDRKLCSRCGSKIRE